MLELPQWWVSVSSLLRKSKEIILPEVCLFKPYFHTLEEAIVLPLPRPTQSFMSHSKNSTGCLVRTDSGIS